MSSLLYLASIAAIDPDLITVILAEIDQERCSFCLCVCFVFCKGLPFLTKVCFFVKKCFVQCIGLLVLNRPRG